MRNITKVVIVLAVAFCVLFSYWFMSMGTTAIDDFTGGPTPDDEDSGSTINSRAYFVGEGHTWYDGEITGAVSSVTVHLDKYTDDVAKVYEPSDWQPMSPVPPPDWGELVGYFWFRCVVSGPGGYSSEWESGGRYPVYTGNTVTNMLGWEKQTGYAYFEESGTYSVRFSIVHDMGSGPWEFASKETKFYVW